MTPANYARLTTHENRPVTILSRLPASVLIVIVWTCLIVAAGSWAWLLAEVA